MATLTAGKLIDRASTLLQDTTNVRWPRTELLDWLNDAQREIVLLLPDAYAKTSSVTGTSGSRQQIPADGIRLIDVTRNTSGRAVRQIDRAVLDAQYPNWHTDTPAAAAIHYTFDKRNPKIFYVYPPATAGASFEVVYSASPTDITSEASTITLDDVYATAIVNFMVYRAYLKDAEYSANDERSKGAYEVFMASLTGKRAADQFVVPDEQVTIAGVRHTPMR